MTIATRVILLQMTATAGIAALGFLIYQSIVNTNYALKRIDVSHHQIEALIEVANSSSQYSEDLSEFLLGGSDFDKASLAEAREQLRGAINKAEETVIAEELFLSEWDQPPDTATEMFTPQTSDNPVAPAASVSERDRIAKIWEMFRSLNRSIDNLVRLSEEGKRAEALKLFDQEIDGKIDAELDAFLAAAIADEEEEHRAVDESVNAQIRKFTAVAGGAAAAAILSFGLLGMGIVRSLRKPMAELLKGAEAFGQGDLNYRMAVLTSDDLGTLAFRFNQMADALSTKQDELASERTSLEAQVRQRTAELAAMNQNLTDLGELRTRFLADISHELRTPLTAIRGEAEITLRHGRKSAETYRETLSRIVELSKEMAKLIDDLLLLARAETDDALFTPRPISIGPVVADAARDAAILGSKKKIVIEAEIASEEIWVEADPQRLKQAVMIPLENAIKYSQAGQRVGITLNPDGDRVLITVRDEGAGIVENDLPHVFKRFYRGQGTGHSSGSGLGLSIAKWIVEKHGGDIRIESAAKSGTQVRIRIPIRGRGNDGESATGRG